MKVAQFYVYQFDDVHGDPLYVGKGTGKRLKQQISRFGRIGHEVARFWKEADAFAFERKLIEHLKPSQNKNRDGNPKMEHILRNLTHGRA